MKFTTRWISIAFFLLSIVALVSPLPTSSNGLTTRDIERKPLSEIQIAARHWYTDATSVSKASDIGVEHQLNGAPLSLESRSKVGNEIKSGLKKWVKIVIIVASVVGGIIVITLVAVFCICCVCVAKGKRDSRNNRDPVSEDMMKV